MIGGAVNVLLVLPPSVRTTTLPDMVELAEITAMICVADVCVKEVASKPPKLTPVTVLSAIPEIVTCVPGAVAIPEIVPGIPTKLNPAKDAVNVPFEATIVPELAFDGTQSGNKLVAELPVWQEAENDIYAFEPVLKITEFTLFKLVPVNETVLPEAAVFEFIPFVTTKPVITGRGWNVAVLFMIYVPA